MTSGDRRGSAFDVAATGPPSGERRWTVERTDEREAQLRRTAVGSAAGSSSKTLITEQGAVPIEIPRDRAGSFEPQIVPKHHRRFDGFDDKIIALYAGGMTTREIEVQLRALYGVEVGRDLISRVTDAVLDDVAQWQSRPLERLYPIVWMDALVVKIRAQGRVQNHHAYLAIGLNDVGVKDVLGSGSRKARARNSGW